MKKIENKLLGDLVDLFANDITEIVKTHGLKKTRKIFKGYPLGKILEDSIKNLTPKEIKQMK